MVGVTTTSLSGRLWLTLSPSLVVETWSSDFFEWVSALLDTSWSLVLGEEQAGDALMNTGYGLMNTGDGLMNTGDGLTHTDAGLMNTGGPHTLGEHS